MTEQTGRNHAACARPAVSRAVARGAVAAALAVASLAAGAADRSQRGRQHVGRGRGHRRDPAGVG